MNDDELARVREMAQDVFRASPQALSVTVYHGREYRFVIGAEGEVVLLAYRPLRPQERGRFVCD
jgi:hypothetical protein